MATSWRARFARWFRPPRTLKTTRSGRTYLVLTLGVGLGALNTGNNLLYLVLGLQLSTIVISGILSERVLRGLTVRRLGADAAFAQEPFVMRWSVRAGPSTAYALTLSEADGQLAGEAKVAVVPAGEERIVRGQLTAPRRGPEPLSAIKVTTTFPLGLFAKSRRYEQADTLVVFPKRGRGQSRLEAPQTGPLGEQSDPRHVDGDGELHALRPLRPDEDARRVHWMKSATAGELLRVEREREQKTAYVLKVPTVTNAQEQDARCEEAANTALRLLRSGHPVGLETADTRLRAASGPKHERRLLRALALLGFGEGVR